MRKTVSFCSLLLTTAVAMAQQPLAPLTVEKIMRDPKWIGSSPSGIQWAQDAKSFYFDWNPDAAPDDSIYVWQTGRPQPVKTSAAERESFLSANAVVYNQDRSAMVYNKNGDIFYKDLKNNIIRRITQTVETESGPQFSFQQQKIAYRRDQNLYAWDIKTGETIQLTNVRSGTANPGGTGGPGGGRSGAGGSGGSNAESEQEAWLKRDQLLYFDVLRSRKDKREQAAEARKAEPKQQELRSIPLQDRSLTGLNLSPDGRFVTYSLYKAPAGVKNTIVPNYVTESGFTVDIPARSKVGAPDGSYSFYLYDREKDTIYSIKPDSLAGIRDLPDYVKDYPAQAEQRRKKNELRNVRFGNTYWAPNSSYALVEIRSTDNKDRWIILLDPATSRYQLLSRQRDEAWIGGPGMFGSIGWINDMQCWYQSEETGYSHIYIHDIKTGTRRALTAGKWEVQQARLSNDKKFFYISSNEVHPGEQHYYKVSIADGRRQQLTSMTGANQVSLSPDEKYLAYLYSSPTHPWELYVQENKPGAKAQQITDKAETAEFRSYAWRQPDVISFKAADGAEVYARVYKPSNPHPNKPAVLFVHGAGYLQNAHKWWSSYFREFMFNNLLADNGYYVMDIDYRGSAGYGRDWRTGIYRHMGGKDLSDHVDAVKYLQATYGVNPAHIGVYGGSYGGFITLMALFTEPDVFAAGAALRPVTDWAQYNHGYTSNILNEPFTDSLAYRRSSPLYFAEGLKGDLLICHGMVDVNVHYQDAVKLSQRLIELGKDNWELASYPMEDHGFVEPSSWTDEYKRIFKLFERVLKK